MKTRFESRFFYHAILMNEKKTIGYLREPLAAAVGLTSRANKPALYCKTQILAENIPAGNSIKWKVYYSSYKFIFVR